MPKQAVFCGTRRRIEMLREISNETEVIVAKTSWDRFPRGERGETRRRGVVVVDKNNYRGRLD